MASLESTVGKNRLKREATLIYAGVKDFSRMYDKGFDQVYDAVTKEMAFEDKAEPAWAQLWNCIIVEWKETHGEMSDHEIDLLTALFRLWILEKYWIEKDQTCKLSEIAKAVRDCDAEFVSVGDGRNKRVKTEAVEGDQKPPMQGEKKIYHETVEAITGKTFILEYSDPEEKKEQIEELKKVLQTGKMM